MKEKTFYLWKNSRLKRGILDEQFPYHYMEVISKEVVVFNMGNYTGDICCWNLSKGEEVMGLEASIKYAEL